ncbi:MAG TPA: GerMN domain-containing protein [Pilimelia sp.]|nr:GerMN domain-containing protein [Pilimelia sp.]
MTDDPTRSTEELLRQVLARRAAAVQVRPDALAAIRRRTGAAPARRLRRLSLGGSMFAVTGAATALAGTVAAVVVGVGSCAPPPVAGPLPPAAPASSPTPGAGPTGAPSAPAGTPPASAAPSGPAATSPPAPAAGGTLLAVYFVGTDRLVREGGTPVTRPRLYREFHRLAAGDGSPAARTRAAVTRMLAAAADPDYRSGWPATTRLRGVGVDGDAVTVDLSGAGRHRVSAEAARIAVQQLVWTATAASGRAGVRLRLDGRPVDRLWGLAATGGTLRRAPAADVVGPVWLIGPQHGAVVARRFTVHVSGVVYEATAQLRVRQGSRTVHERVLTLDRGAPAQGEIRVELTLVPGDYVIEAYAASAVDGSVQHLDDHAVTVR